MQMGYREILWLLLVFPPALLAFFWWSGRTRQALMVQFIQARLLSGLISGVSPARQKIRTAGFILAVACLIVALARPQWGFIWEEARHRGLDIVVAIDTSKSMLATDIAPNRLARAKLAALDLMQQAKADRLGLVAFAGNAFLQCPMTLDETAFRQSVEALDVNTIPQGGTAVADAIQTAVSAFKEGDSHKVLVLFTDGEDHDSGVLEAAQKAAGEGLTIFTVGIGTAEGELLPDTVRDEQGNRVKSHLNEELLRDIARATPKGFYLPLRGAKTIDTLYQQGLAPLPKTESEEKLVRRYQERYQWPLGLAVLLLAAEMLFPERSRESRTKTVAAASPATAGLRAAALFLVLAAFPRLLFGSPASALREYKAGSYDQALKEYQDLIKRNADDPRLRFNAGAAAYQEKQFPEAAKQFNEALNSPDIQLQERAYYNLGNSHYYLGDHEMDPKKKQENWEHSLKDFESSLKLNPQDPDAKYNYQYVKKKLEELKQQQQQQQQNQKDKSDQQNQDQQNQQNQSKQDKDKQKDQDQQNKDQDQQKQSQDNQQAQQKQDQQQQQQQQQKEDQQQQQVAQQKEKEQQQQQAQQSAGQSKEQPGETNAQSAAYDTAQMTPQQAEQLLDARKGNDQMLPLKPPEKPVDPSRPIKDW